MEQLEIQILEAKGTLERMATLDLSHLLFYTLTIDIKWYRRKVLKNRQTELATPP
jgi:hypothetical protein